MFISASLRSCSPNFLSLWHTHSNYTLREREKKIERRDLLGKEILQLKDTLFSFRNRSSSTLIRIVVGEIGEKEREREREGTHTSSCCLSLSDPCSCEANRDVNRETSCRSERNSFSRVVRVASKRSHSNSCSELSVCWRISATRSCGREREFGISIKKNDSLWRREWEMSSAEVSINDSHTTGMWGSEKDRSREINLPIFRTTSHFILAFLLCSNSLPLYRYSVRVCVGTELQSEGSWRYPCPMFWSTRLCGQPQTYQRARARRKWACQHSGAESTGSSPQKAERTYGRKWKESMRTVKNKQDNDNENYVWVSSQPSLLLYYVFPQSLFPSFSELLKAWPVCCPCFEHFIPFSHTHTFSLSFDG